MNRAPHWAIGNARPANPFRIPSIGNAIGDDDTPGLAMWGDSDDYEMDDLEAELDEIEGDLSVCENPYELGAIGKRMKQAGRRKQRLERKAQSGRSGQARRAERRLLRMDQKLERQALRFNQKREKLAKRYGVSPGAVSAVGPQGMADRERIFDESAGYAESGQLGVFKRTPYAGAELPIPFLDDGDPYSVYTFAAGAAQTQSINLATAVIPYAGFIVKGILCNVKISRGENASGFPNQDILWNLIASSVKVNGKLDLLYGAQPVEFIAQGMDGGVGSISLRENPELEVNNTAQLQATFRQEIATAVDYSWSVSFALLVERLRDPAAQMSF